MAKQPNPHERMSLRHESLMARIRPRLANAIAELWILLGCECGMLRFGPRHGEYEYVGPARDVLHTLTLDDVKASCRYLDERREHNAKWAKPSPQSQHGLFEE